MTKIICPICENELNEEESANPRIEPYDDKRIICDDCYRDRYMERCTICENTIDIDDQGHLMLPEGDDRGSPKGIYKILKTPYFLSDCLGSFEMIPERVKKVSGIPDRWKDENAGYVCSECRKKENIS